MALLEVKNLQIAFGGLVAVEDLSFSLEKGKVTSLIGPNGAGKTTVINLLTGFYKPDHGTVTLKDKDITGQPSAQYAKIGLARTFQNIRLFAGMTAQDNVLIGMQHLVPYGAFLSFFPNPVKIKAEKNAIERAEQILERVGLADFRYEKAGNLPYGLQRKLEIGRALATNPSVLLLDEPAAGMNPQETQELSGFVRSLLDDVDAILMIEHDMKMVMQISDHIVVINYGKMISAGNPEHVQNDPVVLEAYLGKGAKKYAKD